MKVYPYNPRPVPTVFLDAYTGAGVTEQGATVQARRTSRRRHIPLDELLGTARAAGAARVYLTGRRELPGQVALRDQLLAGAPEGWRGTGHYLDLSTPVGRFTHPEHGALEVRRAAEWFGEGDYSPSDARAAWTLLGGLYRRGFGERARLLASPAGTGADAWARTTAGEDIAQLDPELAELVRSTSTQGRVELFTADEHRQRCPACVPLVTAAKVPAFHYYDARLAYAPLVRELGCAPAHLVSGEAARELYNAPGGTYARARYHVRYRVPADWAHVGLLLEKDGAEGWHAPNAPGYIGETWADAAELTLALAHGWECQPLAGVIFTPGRPLDKWAARLVTMRERANGDAAAGAYDEPVRELVRAACRSMLLFGIGGFHSLGRDKVHVTDNPLELPDDVVPERRGELYLWRERVPLSGRSAAFAHPEWSAQVWGRARARLLDAPTAEPGVRAGLLHLSAGDVLGCYVDALYIASAPDWPDDGKPGRYRHKGTVPGPLTTPTSAAARNKLRTQAERNTSA